MMIIFPDFICEAQAAGFGLGPCEHDRLANFDIAGINVSEGLVAMVETGSVKKFIIITVSIVKCLV
jgi:hypothetical protein